MKSRSPTFEGFRVMLRQPALGMAEISWRWSTGTAACVLLTYAFLKYLDTLPVSRADLLLLSTRQPSLISQAIGHIFRGSAFRFVSAVLVCMAAIAIAWVLSASLARSASLKWLIEYFRSITAESREAAAPIRGSRNVFGSLVGLNFLRVAATVAAIAGSIGAAILAGFVSSPKDPQPGLVFLLFVSLIGIVWLFWSVLNWFLTLASVFAAHDEQDTFGALAAAVRLYRERMGAVSAVGFWFGLAHVSAFVVATSVVAFPLALAGSVPAGVVLGGVLLVTLLYFAVADFLYAGRLAAYMAMIEFPPAPLVIETLPPQNLEPLQPPEPEPETRRSRVSTEAFDPEDDILSDVP